jgi:type IV secretion system protein VirB9
MSRFSFLIAVSMLALLVAFGTARAEIYPSPGAADIRVKHVDYDGSNVVKVVGHFGFVTHIQLGDGETVQSVAMGDSLAWEVAPTGNHLFVKPREQNAVTNMTVVTAPSNRVYNFVLTAHQSRNGAMPKPNDMFFAIRFRYPDDERRAKEAAAEKAKAANALASTAVVPANWNYWACGAKEIAPDQAFDDGRFTYLRFSANRDMPAVFEELDDGKEALVNTNVDGDRIIVQRVLKRLILRRGPLVACVENRAFDADGISTPSGTVNDTVERSIRSPRP